MDIASDNSYEYEFESNGQRWISSWHSGDVAPAGQRHGSAGLCIVDADEMVMISANGETWDFPAGRPEGNETWEDTLRREMLEEACITITEARLLGFSRGQCIEGKQKGLTLIRAIWLAKVQLLDWNPQFETKSRRLLRPAEALKIIPALYQPFWRHVMSEAGLI